MIKYAVEYISNRKRDSKFIDVFDYVKKKMGLSEDEAMEVIGEFFTDLSLCPEVIDLGDNVFTLRNRVSYEKIKPTIEEDDEEDSEEEEEDEKILDYTNDDDNNNSSYNVIKDIEGEEEEL